MVTINNDDENNFVAGLVGKEAYFGYYESNGNWVWTMPPSSYTHWGPGEPSTEPLCDCAGISLNASWRAVDCGAGGWYAPDYICERLLEN